MIGDDILQGLVARGIPAHVAQGIVTNMQAESGLDTSINEINPTVKGSRGGYGLNQWTGPRRVQFEEYAKQAGVDPSDLDTQLDFTVWELNNSEKRAGNAILAAPDTETAARLYETEFLRPGIPHGNRGRQKNALSSGPTSPQSAPVTPQNALAAPPEKDPGFQLQSTALNAADFMTKPRNALAPMPITYQRFG